MSLDLFFLSYGPLLFKAVIIFMVVIALSQWYAMRKPSFLFWNRKALHVISVALCGWIIQQIYTPFILGIFFLFASVILWLETYLSWLKINTNKSWGVPLFPLAFGLMLLFKIDHYTVAISAYILAFADAGAGIIGNKYGRYFFYPLKERKSLIGALCFFCITMVILFIQPWLSLSIYHLLLISFFATIAELFSWKGSDNFTIVLVTCLSIYFLK